MEWVKIFPNIDEAKRRIQPSKPQLLVVNGKRICLALIDDNFVAVQDACSHNGESLSKGHINYLGEIVCPWHNYRFDLRSGKACDSSSPDLKTYPININETGFFIGI